MSSIQLPKERCADYMRREELASIGMAQKVHTLCEQIKHGQPFHLNSDGNQLMVFFSLSMKFMMEVLKPYFNMLKN